MSESGLENRIRLAITQRRRALGFLMSFPAPYVVELLGRQGGFDFAYADGEHGAFDLRDIEEHCRACELVGLTAIARIPSIDRGVISGFLDRGIRGIVAPHLESAEQARRLVDACRFYPQGSRSYGAGRNEKLGVRYDLTRHCQDWNSCVTIGAMIESRAGIDALDEILKVDGIDYFMTGANDLAQALGHPGEPCHPAVSRANAEIARRVHAAGKPMREDITQQVWTRDLLLDAASRFTTIATTRSPDGKLA